MYIHSVKPHTMCIHKTRIHTVYNHTHICAAGADICGVGDAAGKVARRGPLREHSLYQERNANYINIYINIYIYIHIYIYVYICIL